MEALCLNIPFIGHKFSNNSEIWTNAKSVLNPTEQVKLWPYECLEKTFIVAVYAKASFSPLKFKANGFLVLNEEGTPLEDISFCQKVARDFHIWYRLYFHPVVKNVIFRKKVFSEMKRMHQIIFEDCKKRYESNEYVTNDPSKKAYFEMLKKLDLDVINSYELHIKNLQALEEVVSVQYSICESCSCEKINSFRQALLKYQPICSELAKYTAKRGELYYDYERAIKEAYHIDLETSKHSILSKLGMSCLLWLANSPLQSLAIPFLPEVLKLIYQNLAGYKSLLKASVSYSKKSDSISSFLKLFDKTIDSGQIRNSSVSKNKQQMQPKS